MDNVPEPWDVWKIWWADGHPIAKYKRVMVVYCNSYCVAGFFLNSRQRTKYLDNPRMEVCDFQISAAGNYFLDRDSWLNVSDWWELPYTDIERRLGYIPGQYRDDIVIAIKSCPVLKERHKDVALKHLC